MRFLRPKEHEAYILLKTKEKSYLRGFQLRLENETKVVTLANHNGRRQSNEPIKTRSNYMKLTQDAGKLVHASYDCL